MKYQLKYPLLLAILTSPLLLQAQDAAVKASFLDNNFKQVMLILIIISFTVVLLALYFVLKSLLYLLAKDILGEEAAKKYTILPTLNIKWAKFSKKLTDAVPIEREKDILLDHDYDGIKELDNHLPPWWKWMFYATIAYAFIYFGYFTVWKIGPNQYEKYDKKIALLQVQKAEYLASAANSVDENTVTLLTDASMLANGKNTFIANCATCHGELGEGKIGPNLTDEFWIHGGSIKDIFTTVKYGVANKMIPWQDQLLPSEMSEVASYVASLKGSNPPNALAPQGELYTPETAAADSSSVQ
jgi:cytochrome c oxidase cbb3-type subunit 3